MSTHDLRDQLDGLISGVDAIYPESMSLLHRVRRKTSSNSPDELEMLLKFLLFLRTLGMGIEQQGSHSLATLQTSSMANFYFIVRAGQQPAVLLLTMLAIRPVCRRHHSNWAGARAAPTCELERTSSLSLLVVIRLGVLLLRSPSLFGLRGVRPSSLQPAAQAALRYIVCSSTYLVELNIPRDNLIAHGQAAGQPLARRISKVKLFS